MGFGPNSIGWRHQERRPDPVGTGGWTHFIDNFWGKPGPITSPRVTEPGGLGGQHRRPVPLPDGDAGLLPVRLRSHHPAPLHGQRAGPDQVQRLVPPGAAVVDVRLRIDAFLLWGGGYFAQEGALDFSGGYVIHMSAGVSGFVAAWVLGPRLLRDRQHALPNNLVMAAVGAGILWLGWNGFNGGDPYYAGADAAAAVVNTNLATATGVMVWIAMDAWLSKEKKPTFLGGVNGMICGLVGITPCAGWVNG